MDRNNKKHTTMAKIGEMIQNPTIGQIMARAAAEQNWFKEQMAETGHETNTMLWNDFTIADYYGIKSVMDTYNKALNASKSYDAEKKKNKYNEKVIAELYIVLNWKIWALYEKNNTLARHYNDLWEKCYDFAEKHLDKEQLSYFYRTTD